MKVYNKLVRDRIPEMIAASGRSCEVQVLEPEAYRHHLVTKLEEELREYQATTDVAELADLVEVVYALVRESGMSVEQFHALRESKLQERGGFSQRLLLIGVRDY